jgi:HEAT repeat protein
VHELLSSGPEEAAAVVKDPPLISVLLDGMRAGDERAKEATRVLEGYLDDGSGDVRAWALSAIVAIANDHAALRDGAREHLREAVESDAEPVRARAQMLSGQADSWPSST